MNALMSAQCEPSTRFHSLQRSRLYLQITRERALMLISVLSVPNSTEAPLTVECLAVL